MCKEVLVITGSSTMSKTRNNSARISEILEGGVQQDGLEQSVLPRKEWSTKSLHFSDKTKLEIILDSLNWWKKNDGKQGLGQILMSSGETSSRWVCSSKSATSSHPYDLHGEDEGCPYLLNIRGRETIRDIKSDRTYFKKNFLTAKKECPSNT
jgi:hypothetical protein